ncbi:WD40-like Beta Propeller Repeat [Tenacibaculum sp. MAR_2009_124]|uniref:TolB family protein n=1 Tax=Tenacibaculum sp. MAR_2009_124 TaxID=1250059 RepID=UPI00089BB737|nr:PD40 domain-containing protein [Tenacibaculum sp. MAR_2009_124]SEB96533.1 WD40-like Beta Propeller Repeat [Tenacibaculum sp. MAR_2009_124]
MRFVAIFYLLIFAVSGQESKLFLPELFRDFGHVRDISIGNDGTEIYFTAQGYLKEYSYIVSSKKINGNWKELEIVSFSGQKGIKDLEPFLSPDGLKLFFASNRERIGAGAKKDMDIWYVERESLLQKWSLPINLGETINGDKDEFYPSVSKNGNLYFTSEREDSKGKEDIYVSEIVDGEYLKPKPLNDAVNSDKFEYNAFVSPNEDYIIFTSYGRKDDLGRGDMYISKKNSLGSWMTAKHMGNNINTKREEYCPFVDFENKMLYFTSVRTETIDVLEPKRNLKGMLKKIEVLPNGLSRIYCTPLNKI